MKDAGIMIRDTDLDLKNFKQEILTSENILKVRFKVKADTNGLQVSGMKVNGLKEKNKASDNGWVQIKIIM